jgi:hypothetical protein
MANSTDNECGTNDEDGNILAESSDLRYPRYHYFGQYSSKYFQQSSLTNKEDHADSKNNAQDPVKYVQSVVNVSDSCIDILTHLSRLNNCANKFVESDISVLVLVEKQEDMFRFIEMVRA